ncbi:hypothetical protein SERLA73DRAFT_160549 [Serpula lacrymans var. lacrymans S7.3]|uniref:Uncharacterized protein n=1 Tax=Serpula lacrymans var. lacrymans (strain S7.3) TaxID=936435 RepID=F8PYI8_SERL3|nr:hypothetical protein SERLA73DRAFT_160549 [Serpula lacrymans var. lacrymans S7.3]
MSTNSKTPVREDAILPMKNDAMQLILQGVKNYEFRSYLIAHTVHRVWFYLNAPLSHLAYICEIDPARTRKGGDPPLPEDGVGNKEFNEGSADWARIGYAYRIRSLYKLRHPIHLRDLKARYGLKGAPRSLVYAPPKILADVAWNDQERIIPGSAGTSLDSYWHPKAGVPKPIKSNSSDLKRKRRYSTESIDLKQRNKQRT